MFKRFEKKWDFGDILTGLAGLTMVAFLVCCTVLMML